ncbi:MAG: right-handed parallel beta-helix repeat-containing protein [Sedimentisphaerales bacterium]|nr:right-handed parallel beta-helix repeat-containing protein [Sedimentisphaerales bacterium]
MKRAILAGIVFAALLSAPAPAKTRYVPAAYHTIQAAINDSNDGDIVIVARGTHNERIDFLGKNITVTSTDPNDPAVVADTIINAGGTGSAVKFTNGESRLAVITGFTLTGGYGTTYMEEDVLFWGGGVVCIESSPTIEKNLITNNNGPASEDPPAISYGGAIGAYLADPLIRNNIITNNTAAAGAGIIIYFGNALITDNLIYDNSGVIGGGVVLLGGTLINNTIVANDASLSSDLGDNMAGNVYAASEYQYQMYESTVVNNIIANARSAGGLLYINTADDAIAFNNVFGNAMGNYLGADPTTGEMVIDGPADKTGILGNISADPLFADPGAGDYHILQDSPCISAGDPAFVPAPNQKDIDGDPRIYAVIVDIGADEYIGYVKPVANAGPDIHVTEPGPITLDGANSFFYDPCDPKIYNWTQTAGTAVTLSDPHSPAPTFTAEAFGLYRFQLTVGDGEYTSGPDQVTVMVGNAPPVADAGPDKVVSVPDRVALDGSASRDPDPIDELVYSWTQLEGPIVTLQNAHTATPFFHCIEEGVYSFQLIVSDGLVQSRPDTVRIATVAATIMQEYVDVESGINGLCHYPDVSAGKVVYAFGWGEDYDWDIACRDTQTNEVVSFAAGGIDTQPKIDGDIVVWSGGPYYNDPGWPLRNTGIFVRNLVSEEQITLQPGTSFQSYSHPVVSGNKVVFLAHVEVDVHSEPEWRMMPYDICGADITDLQNPRIFWVAFGVANRDPYRTDDPSMDFDSVVDIAGNIIVWEAHGDIFGADVSDLDNIRIFTICDDPARQYDPAISGGFVVWTDQRNDSGDIYGAYISDLENIRIIPIVQAIGTQLQPAIDRNIIIYVNGNEYGGSIEALCMTRRYGALDIELQNYPYGVGPAIGDGLVIWQTGNYGYAQAIALDVQYSVSDGPVKNAATHKRYDYIQHAVNAASDGDRIIADNGIYYESIDLKGKNLTVNSTATTDPAVVAATIIRSSATAVSFTGEEDPNCSLAGFTIQGGDRAIYCFGASPVIENCVITDCTGPGIELFGASKPQIKNCYITANADCGIKMWPHRTGRITLYNTPEVTGCVIAENRQHGISGGIPAINNCTIVANLESGTYTGRPNIANSIIYYNGDHSAESQIAGGIPAVTHTNVQGSWPGTGNIAEDPAFVQLGGYDPNGHAIRPDYHLCPASPCINAGDPNLTAGQNDTDIDGQTRIMLETVDMGADEFNPFEVEFLVVDKERITRTVFEYQCRAVLKNVSTCTAINVRLKVAGASKNMTASDPNLSFGEMPVGPGQSAVSTDTCSFTVDRTKAIEPGRIIWHCQSQVVEAGQPAVLKASGALLFTPTAPLPADIAPNGQIDYADMAKLAAQWLWKGTPNEVPQDLAADGVVNLADFAELARQWKK